jgi:dolichyl-phosphate-mannose-protein mannosyltransferase
MSKDLPELKNQSRPKQSNAYTLLAIFSVAMVIAGIVARIYKLGFPYKPVFDEVYFPVFANNFIHGIQSFDVHPPLGKFMMAAGIAIFGNVSLGWRAVPVFFGVALLGLVAFLARDSFKDRVAFLIAPVLFSLDGMLVVYSRIGLMDGVLLFFVLLVFFLAIRAKGTVALIAIAVLLGMAVGIKWIGIGILVPVAFVLWRKKQLAEFAWYVPISVVVYGLSVAAGDWVSHDPHPWLAMLEWHKQAFHYHLSLTATHPWSSQWWSWPLMLRPVLFFYEVDALGKVQIITSLGNPIIWWASTAAVILSIAHMIQVGFRNRHALLDHPLTPLLLGYFTFFIPWVFIHRVVFLYHYMISYGFALLMLSYWLVQLWKKQKPVVFAFLCIASLIGFYYLPLAMALPLTQEVLQKHFWFASWL